MLSASQPKLELYRSIILPVALYGYDVSFVKYGKKQRVWKIEDRMLKGIFGPEKKRRGEMK
jgi:hypothetical protein